MRKKARGAMVGYVVVMVLLFLMAREFGYLIFTLAIFPILGFAYYLQTLKCVYCDKPILYNKLPWIGTYSWTPWIPDNCPKCGTRIG